MCTNPHTTYLRFVHRTATRTWLFNLTCETPITKQRGGPKPHFHISYAGRSGEAPFWPPTSPPLHSLVV